MRWLEENRTMVISDYHRAFCAAFRRRDVSSIHLHGLRKRKGWKVGRAKGRFAGRHLLYSAQEIEWLRGSCSMPLAEWHKAFCVKFNRSDIAASQLHFLRKNQKWKTGRTGHFEKGAAPWNTGKKIGNNPGSAKTQFKNGDRTGRAAALYKPIGSERLINQGYLERKIHDGLPVRSRWRFVHLLNWENIHGPIPVGMALKCKGDRSDTDPSNWELVPRGLLPRLNGRHGRDYDHAPAELKPTIMAVAKLEHQLRGKGGSRNAARTA